MAIKRLKDEENISKVKENSVKDIELDREVTLLEKIRAMSINYELGEVVIGSKTVKIGQEELLLAAIDAFRKVCLYIDDDDLHKNQRFNIAFENFQEDCNNIEVKNFELLQELKEAINV